MDVKRTPEWKALAANYDAISTRHLRELFAEDPERTGRLTAEAADLVLDYSKQRVTDETMRLLMDLADAAGVEAHRDAMFAGEHINTTEDRAVLHVALRMPPGSVLHVDGQDVVGDVQAVLTKMGDLSDRIRNGSWTGATGKRIAAVVNIGIGGSDLGPAMATLALADYAQPGLDEPLRLERRPSRPLRGHPRPGSRDDALRRQLQDLHHVGNPDQRCRRQGLAAVGSGQRRR